MSTGAVHLFLGPTLPAADATALLPDVEIHPPIVQGDVLRVLYEQAAAIAIVDGYFDVVPAVSHKEILVALSMGVPVFGAASMGALRAAELHQFGMVGVGRIFEQYRDGVLEDDDEVAVVHGRTDDAFRAFSTALVDLRDLYELAAEAGVIDSQMRELLVSTARQLSYPERHHRRVVADAVRAAPELEPYVGALDAFAAARGAGAKARDALELLAVLRDLDFADAGSKPAPLRVEPTVFLHRISNEVALERAARVSPLPEPHVPLRGLDSRAVLEKKVLSRLLARRLAPFERVPIEPGDVADALARFRADFDLTDDEAFEEWRRSEGVGEGALIEFLRDWVVLDKFQRQLAREVDAMVADQLRIATARSRVETAGGTDLSGLRSEI